MVNRSAEILKLDYTTSRAMIDKFDSYILQTMSWSIAACGGVLFLGVTRGSILVTSCAILVALFFDTFAYIFKTFQVDVIEHSVAVEKILNEAADLTSFATDSYQFGVGHAIRPLTFSRLWGTMATPMHSFLHLFFALICLLVIFADVFIFFGAH